MQKIAVASQNRRDVTGHTGRCRRFWIYHITDVGGMISKQLLEIPKTGTFHETSPHEPHPLDAVQLLISGGMGNGIRRRLAARGIETVVTREVDPDTSVNAWLNGRLEIVPPEAGRQHDGSHGHAAGSACGCGHA